MKKIRVLHAPTTVGGNPQGLARAERELGLRSWSVTLVQNYFNYPADEVVFNHESLFLNELKRLAFYIKVLSQFDVIHYNCGTTIASPSLLLSVNPSPRILKRIRYHYTKILGVLELKLLMLLKKPIFLTFQGDDARQADYCLKHFKISPATEVDKGYYSKQSDIEKRKRIAHFDQYVEHIYSVNPDLLYVLPERAEFVPYAHVDLNNWRPVSSTAGKLKVIHAPSHKAFKGTRFVLEAIKLLKEEGFDFDFELIENLSHSAARKRYEKADLLIDQLLAGWYGGLAVELMALGKPVICYIRKPDLKFIPNKMARDLPVINATPDTIYPILRKWIIKPRADLIKLGIKSRQYVERWHNPQKIAAKLKCDYEAALTKRGKIR